MTETDFRYLLKRLGYKADQPIGLALWRVLGRGDPMGPAARRYSVPVGRLEQALHSARDIQSHFTVTSAESAALGLSSDAANRLLSYARSREVPISEKAHPVTAAQLRAAGLTDDQITELFACD